MTNSIRELFRILRDDEGQDIAEYAVMSVVLLVVILVLVAGKIRLVGSNANNAFPAVCKFDPVIKRFCRAEVGG